MLTVSQKQNILKTRELFIKHYNEEPTDYFKSCGRLEIIGNHVDYNGGSVINSSAGNLNILTSVKKSDDNKIVVKSEGYPDLVVEADGGINNKTYLTCKEAGLDIAVAGTAVFGAEDPAKAIENLR